jgi:hypothetical protein
VASHSYNMAATDEAARRIESENRSYWQTEASANGPEEPGDAIQSTSLAARFLSDMNHRVTHWIHFLGFERPDPNDNVTRILAFTAQPLRVTTFHKYFTYRQLVRAFDVGATFRDSQSSLDGDMAWTYGKKARVTAAAARNPDVTWAIGVSNFDPNDNNGYANGYKSKAFNVTLLVPELAACPNWPRARTGRVPELAACPNWPRARTGRVPELAACPNWPRAETCALPCAAAASGRTTPTRARSP